MSFPKDPRLMVDEELCAWANALIERQAPESSMLDYKARIAIEKTNERIELAKDVSSFANESGGTLLYGVPEIEGDNGPIPKTLSDCGINVAENLPEKIESILIDSIVPPLPELHIRVFKLSNEKDKSLLMIHHPESWCKPHMIEGYKEHRFYRRGNYRTVLMREREVEAAYLFRKVSTAHAEDFFRNGNFTPFPRDGNFLRVIICPRFSIIQRQGMSEEKFKAWLESNTPNNRPGEWIPFMDGWRFRGNPPGKFHGKQYELRLFHNGGYCFDLDLISYALNSMVNELNLIKIKKIFKDMILPYAGKALEYLRISGPLSVQVNLHNVQGLNACVFYPGATDSSQRISGPTPLEKTEMLFMEETSVSELLINQDKILTILLDRLCSTFGIFYPNIAQYLSA